MAALGLAAESLDLLFLSHIHWDHIGGWDSILELNPRATVVVHEGFSKHLIRDLQGLCGELIVVGADPRPLDQGLFSTGMLDSNPPEQALAIDTGEATAAISGCAHPGIEQMVERGAYLLGKSVDWAIGGSHLMDANPVRIEQSVRALKALGVIGVVPTHCTGDAGKAASRRAFGAACLAGGIGREIGG